MASNKSSASLPSNFIDLQEWKGLSEVFKKGAHPGLVVLFYTRATCGFCADAEQEFCSIAEANPEAFFVRLDISVPGRDSMCGVPGTMLGQPLEGTPTFFLYKDNKSIETVVGAGKLDQLRELIAANK